MKTTRKRPIFFGSQPNHPDIPNFRYKNPVLLKQNPKQKFAQAKSKEPIPRKVPGPKKHYPPRLYTCKSMKMNVFVFWVGYDMRKGVRAPRELRPRACEGGW